MTTFQQIADQLEGDGHYEMANELRGCKDVREDVVTFRDDKLISGLVNASVYMGSEDGLQAAVDEMIVRLGECDSPDAPVRLALSAIVERDALNGIFAYQFLSTSATGPLVYTNIATWIPAHDGLYKNLLQIQQPGGRPYGIAIKEKRIITNEVANHLFNNFSHFPDFKETLKAGDLGDIKENLRELVQEFGVRRSIIILETAESQFQSDRDYVQTASDNYGA
jgi:hypothetical protein